MKMLMMLGLFALAQQDAEEVDVPMLSVEELSLQYYPVQHVDADRLENELTGLIGRAFYIKERGGYHAEEVWNLRALGGNLIVYDTPDYAKRVLEMAALLDKPSTTLEEPDLPLIEVYEYRPRYLSMEGVHRALQVYQRNVFDGYASGPNISIVEDRSIFLIRESSERMAEMVGALKRLDKPQQQILITCWLVTAEEVDEYNRVPLPDDLVQHMKLLVPQYELTGSGFGMLRTSTSSGQERIVKLDEWGHELRFRPRAFDTESGALTVDDCALLARQVVSFTTDTLLGANEYTVIGASGSNPVFVVIRVQPI